MKKRSESNDSADDLRRRIIGLGDQSGRKSYYPELQDKITQLENEIAERQSAEAGHARLSAVIESTTDMVSTSTVERKITYLNSAGARLLGWDLDQIASKTIADAHPPWARDRILNEGLPTAGRDGVWEGETAVLGPTGREIPVSQVIIAHRSSSGDIDYYSTIIRDITERKQTEEVLQSIMEGTASASAETFFSTLVERLSSVLGVKYAMVAELAEGREETARTLAVCANGTHVDNFEYNLHGSPCEEVVGKTLCYYPENVAALFPEDTLLSEMGIYSFLGTPLFDSSDEPLGVLAVMHHEKIPHPEMAKRILSIFAFRAGAELERKHTLEALTRRDAILEVVSRAATVLLESESWESRIEEILADLGEATDTDAVSIYVSEGHNKNGQTEVSEHNLWKSAAADADPALHPRPRRTTLAEVGFTRWEQLLAKGEVISGNAQDFPAQERATLSAHNVMSLAVVPVFADESWWGAIGFSDSKQRRSWTSAELDGLRTLAETLGAAIQRQKGRQDLRESEAKWRSVVENAPGFITTIGPDHRIQFINRVEPGRILDDALGSSVYDFINVDYREAAKEAIDSVFQSARSTHYESIVTRVDGSTIWYDNQVGPVLHDGRVVAVTIIGSDITDRKRAEVALQQSEEKYRVLFEESADALSVIEDGKFVSCNDACLSMLVCDSAGQIIGRHPAELSPPTQPDGQNSYDKAEETMATAHERGSLRLEWEHKRASGELFPAEITLTSVPIGDKRVLHCVWRDITDRKQTQKALQRSEEKYRVLYEQSADAILIIEDGHFVDCNDATIAMLRYENKEQFLNAHPSELSPDLQSDGRDSFEKAKEMMRIAHERGSHRFEWEHKRADGEVFFVEVSLTMIPVEEKDILHTIWRDITDRKIAEKSLLRSEATLKTTLQAAPVGVGLVTNRILGWTNERISEMLGYTQDELNGMPARNLYETEEEFERAGKKKHGVVERTSVGSVETRWVCKDGSVIDVLLSSATIDAENWQLGLVFSVQDITERKRNEELQRGRNIVLERLASSDSLAEVLSAIVDNVEHVRPGVRCSAKLVDREANCLRHGAAPSMPQSFNMAVDGAGIGEGIGTCGTAAHRKERVVIEDVMRHPFWADFVDLAVRTGIRGSWSEPIVASNGDLLGVFAMYFDHPTAQNDSDMELLTTATNLAGIAMEKRLIEEALRQREESYRTLVETMNEGFIGLDVEDRITYANQRACSLLEYGREELVGLSVMVLLDDENRDVFQTQLDTRSNDSHESFELMWMSRSGRKVRTLVSPRDVRDETDEYSGLFAVITDITELKELEDRVARSKKMELLGRLAGTVAHDLNNVLSGLVTYPDLLLMQIDPSSPLYQPLETIKESGERAAAIVEDLLTLARRGVPVREVVDLNSIVEDRLKSPEFNQLCAENAGIQFKTSLSQKAQRIMGSTVHLAQTVTNLILNAAEAMPDGGQLTIVTRSQYVDGIITGYDSVEEGEYAVLELTDTGTGIPPEDLKRIFEPFYTRKVMGRSGTGLGLTVVWGTVNDHDGYIEVDSKQGQGTTFRLYFPATIAPDEQPTGVDQTVRPMGTGQLFLVVDDAEHQRLIASEMLTSLGFKVVTASSGEEAVEYVKENEVEVILLDMAMGDGMDGLDTYREIVGFRPNQKAIIASGYAATERVEETLRLGAGRYIKKPYSLHSMAKAIKAELNVTDED